MSLRDVHRFGVGALVVCSGLPACAGTSVENDDRNVPGELAARASAEISIPAADGEAGAAASRKKQCPCQGRSFVGFTTAHYTVGLGIPGTCSLNASMACNTDEDCANSGNVGTCSGSQDFGDGFLAADALCSAEFPQSVVCTSAELLESVRSGDVADMPAAAWYNSSVVLDNYRWRGSFTSPIWPLACCR
jgi:hypothetical protein